MIFFVDQKEGYRNLHNSYNLLLDAKTHARPILLSPSIITFVVMLYTYV